jgi:hypothetical protein
MTTMFKVTIEWNGNKPPTTWYKRLHSLGLIVRGDPATLDPIVRRTAGQKTNNIDTAYAVIVQEGNVACASESLAHEIYYLALEQNLATMVTLEEVNQVKMGEMSAMDKFCLDRIQAVFGKKGRPTDPKQDWLVTCFECGRSFSEVDVRAVAACPFCHGGLISSRVGVHNRYCMPASGDTFSKWVRLRFATGEFEVPVVEPGAPEPVATVTIKYDRLKVILDQIIANTDMLSKIDKLVDPFRFLDGLFCSRAYSLPGRLEKERLQACIVLFTQYANMVDPAKIVMAVTDKVDALDSAPVLGNTTAAELYLQLR